MVVLSESGPDRSLGIIIIKLKVLDLYSIRANEGQGDKDFGA